MILQKINDTFQFYANTGFAQSDVKFVHCIDEGIEKEVDITAIKIEKDKLIAWLKTK